MQCHAGPVLHYILHMLHAYVGFSLELSSISQLSAMSKGPSTVAHILQSPSGY